MRLLMIGGGMQLLIILLALGIVGCQLYPVEACVKAVKAARLEKDTNLSEISAEATARITCLKAANGKD